MCEAGCKYRPSCPLDQVHIQLPIGYECPVERTMLSMEAKKLRDGLEVGPDDPWSLALTEYASLWKVLMRRGLIESTNGVVVESYRGVDKAGNVLYEKKLNPALEFVEKARKVLHDIGEDLIATRKAKFKLEIGARKAIGPEETLKRIEDKIAKIKAAVGTKVDEIPQDQIIDAEFVKTITSPLPPPPIVPDDEDDESPVDP